MVDLVGITDGTAATYTTTTVDNSYLDKDDFLQLLVTQLKYQDPTQPMDNQQLASQLAQYSSLETLNNIQSTLEDSTTLQQSLNNSFMTSLIGKDIQAYGNTLNYGGKDVTLEYNLASAASEVTLTITDENGDTVRTVDVGSQSSGDVKYTWDGTDDNGNYVAEGNYTYSVTAVDSTGAEVAVTPYCTGRVEGITYVEGSPYLVVNGSTVNLGNVVSVLDSSDDDSGSGDDNLVETLQNLVKI